MAEKLYPFSTQKHAHDIELMENRAYIIMREMESGDVPWNQKTYDEASKRFDALSELLPAVLNSRDGRVCYLNGKQLSLAKEAVLWAGNYRADKTKRREEPER